MIAGYLPGLKYTTLHLVKVTVAEDYKTFCFMKFKTRCVKKEVKVEEGEMKYVELEPGSSNSVSFIKNVYEWSSLICSSIMSPPCVHIAGLVANRLRK